MLLTLANLGDALAKLFRFLYTQLCCCGCCRPIVIRHPPSRSTSGGGVGGAGERGADDPLGRNGSAHEAWKTQFEENRRSQDPVGSNSTSGMDAEIQVVEERRKGGGNDWDGDEEEEDEEEEEGFDDIDNADYNEITVPLTIILGVIAGYIFLGTVIFGVWEGWDPLTAAYFCFITISTIGFGDVVPGFASSGGGSGGEYEMLGTALYMLFGMATLSMCFTLVQDQMVVKFRLMAKKLRKAVRRRRRGEGRSRGGVAKSPDDDDWSSSVGGATGSTYRDRFLEMRRQRRAGRFKLQWLRKTLSRRQRKQEIEVVGDQPEVQVGASGDLEAGQRNDRKWSSRRASGRWSRRNGRKVTPTPTPTP